MSKVVIYTKKVCPYCVWAKNLLRSREIPFEEIVVDVDKPASFYEDLKKRTGWSTVPQIFINDKLVGGYTELKAMDDSGELQRAFSA